MKMLHNKELVSIFSSQFCENQNIWATPTNKKLLKHPGDFKLRLQEGTIGKSLNLGKS